jgi:hypothetical protein
MTGCQKDDVYEPVLAPADCALIHGRLTGAADPLPATITAMSLPGGDSYSSLTGADGAYAIVVPLGRYTVVAEGKPYAGRLYFTSAGPSLTQRDTLDLSAFSPTAVADFPLSAVRADIRFPASYAGSKIRVVASLDAQGYVYRREQEVRVPDSLHTSCTVDGLPAGLASVYVTGVGAALPVAEAKAVAIRAGAITPIFLDCLEVCTIRATLRGSWPRLAELGSWDQSEPTVGLEVWSADSAQVAVLQVPALLDGDVARLEFRLPGRGSVRFRVRAAQLARWIGGSSFESASSWELQPGATLDLPEIVEAGILCHLEPSFPVPWFPATVSFYDSSGSLLGRGSAPCGWCLDVPGNIVYFCGLDPGSYFLHLDQGPCGGSWLPRWYPEAVTRDAALPVVIASAGQLVEISWPLVEGGRIGGQITGVTPSFAQVKLFSPADTSAALCSGYTEQPGGAFTFSALADGAYFLCIERPVPHALKLVWYPGSWSAAQAETLFVRDRIGPPPLRWTLP